MNMARRIWAKKKDIERYREWALYAYFLYRVDILQLYQHMHFFISHTGATDSSDFSHSDLIALILIQA